MQSAAPPVPPEVIPDMETEEGFNLAIRRMLRSSNTYYVIHVGYSAFSFMRNNQDLLQLLQNTTQDTVQPHGGTIYQMRKGDQFVVFTEAAGPKIATMVDNITAAAFPDREPGDDDEQVLARAFRVPQDYLELRRTASVYLDSTGAPMAPAPPAPVAADAKDAEAAAMGKQEAGEAGADARPPGPDAAVMGRGQHLVRQDHSATAHLGQPSLEKRVVIAKERRRIHVQNVDGPVCECR